MAGTLTTHRNSQSLNKSQVSLNFFISTSTLTSFIWCSDFNRFAIPSTFLSATLLSLFVRLVTESGAVLGGRPDLLHHPAGTVLGGYGGVCGGEVSPES